MRKLFRRLLRLFGFLIIILILLDVFYVAYKHFSDEANIKLSGSLSINYENGNKLHIFKKKTVHFSVINTSDNDVYYYIEFKNLKNIKGKIKYHLKGGENTIDDTLNAFNTTIAREILIEAGKTEEYTLTFNADKFSIYGLEINVSEENSEKLNFADIIIRNNEVKDKPVTSVGSEIATENEGLIKSKDDLGNAYYFRGNVKNNYVLIDDLLYRIVRINGDGSVKLILNDVTEAQKNYYDGESFSFKGSIIMNYLNNEWKTYNIGDSEYYIASHKYCNDLSKDNAEYLALKRIQTDNIPSLVCIGSKVSSKIALLSVDEVIFAGATLNAENTSFYLYNEKIPGNYFLMSSAKEDNGVYYPFAVSQNGQILTNVPGNAPAYIRPVITIIKTAYATGDGSVNSPYILSSEH